MEKQAVMNEIMFPDRREKDGDEKEERCEDEKEEREKTREEKSFFCVFINTGHSYKDKKPKK